MTRSVSKRAAEEEEEAEEEIGFFIKKSKSVHLKRSKTRLSLDETSRCKRMASVKGPLVKNVLPLIECVAFNGNFNERQILHLLACENDAVSLRQFIAENNVVEVKKAILDADEHGNTGWCSNDWMLNPICL